MMTHTHGSMVVSFRSGSLMRTRERAASHPVVRERNDSECVARFLGKESSTQ